MTSLAFDHRVTYRRDLRVPFAGPAARHLSPVNTRLRAPAEAALGAPKDKGPVLPPLFELAATGRRPRVFEVVTFAAEGEAFDLEHARFGRPASSEIGGARALLSVDRKEYDPGATLYFACDTLDPESGLFASKSPAPNATVRFRGRTAQGGGVRSLRLRILEPRIGTVIGQRQEGARRLYQRARLSRPRAYRPVRRRGARRGCVLER